MKITAAVVQMTSTTDKKRNMDAAVELVDRAAGMGAEIVALPENWLYMRGPNDPMIKGVDMEGPELSALRDLARSRSIYLLAGTVPERIEDSKKVYNTSILFGPNGGVLAKYRKIHLFDINLTGGETHKESNFVKPGNKAVVAKTKFMKVGLSVCYDLRFPELYRRMALNGARLFFIPAAFTERTGRDHWDILLRARAVENLCFVLAPAQHGSNTSSRTTYGRSAIIDPWGTVIARAPDMETVSLAELDLDFQDRVRSDLPCLEHAHKWLNGQK
jgi:predicted amidohydrolase